MKKYKWFNSWKLERNWESEGERGKERVKNQELFVVKTYTDTGDTTMSIAANVEIDSSSVFFLKSSSRSSAMDEIILSIAPYHFLTSHVVNFFYCCKAKRATAHRKLLSYSRSHSVCIARCVCIQANIKPIL